MPDPSAEAGNTRQAAALMAIALAVLPLLAVRYAPVTDLPQHLAQIRLLEELLGLAPRTLDTSSLQILWTSPSILVYAPMLATVRLFGPLVGARVLLGLLLAGQVGAIHLVAARRDRPLAGALLAGVLVFNHALYWGFLNLMSAVPFFLLLVDHAARAPDARRPIRDAGVVFTLGAVTYLAHSITFACGALATVGFGVARRDSFRAILPRLVALSPPVVAALVWFPALAARRRAAGFDLGAVWYTSVLDRLSPSLLVDAHFGGLGGATEPVALLAILLYVGLALGTNARSLRTTVDRPLAAAAGVLFVAYLLSPDKWVNTLLFAQRFMPLAAILGVLAVPAPRIARKALLGFALAVPLVFAIATTTMWSVFETNELSGLDASLRVIERPRRVVGIDLRRMVPELKTRPFIQLFAYVQAEHGGDLSFSFAEHASSIVAYRTPRRAPWTAGLEWFPRNLTRRDLRFFDYALVIGDESMHTSFAAATSARPLVREGQVRAYAIPRQPRPERPN